MLIAGVGGKKNGFIENQELFDTYKDARSDLEELKWKDISDNLKIRKEDGKLFSDLTEKILLRIIFSGKEQNLQLKRKWLKCGKM